MKVAAIRVLLAAALVGFAICLALSITMRVDLEAGLGYARDLREMHALDSALNDHLMRSRTGLTMSYDPLVEALARLHKLDLRLAATPRFLPAGARGELAAGRMDVEQALADKQRLIEAFKTDNAVLRNSVNYFPIGARSLADRLRAAPHCAELAARLNHLMGDVLLFSVLPPDPERDGAVASSMEGVRARAAVAGEIQDADLENLLAHARVVIDRKPRVDALVKEILSNPLTDRVKALESTYLHHEHAAIDSAAHLRLALSVLAVLMLALAGGEVILRIRRSAAALAQTKDELVVANRALRLERQREQELGELKSRFVSMASHEFRTPLSIIQSSADIIEAYAPTLTEEKRINHVHRIHAAVGTMNELLDAVLLIGKDDAGKSEYDPAPLDLPRFCEDFAQAMQQSAGNEHTIVFSSRGDYEGAKMDDKLLGHILTNLLSNALKYAPATGSVVEFDLRRDGDDAVFEVRDRGIGIPPEDQERLFQSFHRASNVRNISGTGLGLAIVRRSVDLHGGSISFQSELGVGTRFTVRIPLHRDASDAP